MDRAGPLAMFESNGPTRYPDLTSTRAHGGLSQLNHSEPTISCLTTLLFLNDGPDIQYDHVPATLNVAPTASKRFFVKQNAAEPATMRAGTRVKMKPWSRGARW